jgi:hypothetical protein
MTAQILRTAAVAALLWVTSSWAQVIYKSTMPDGHVIYGHDPAPGAERVETLKPSTEDTGVQPLGSKDQSGAQQSDLQPERQAVHQDEIEQAEQAVRDAEAALGAGKEPLAGERLGTAGGNSRLSDEYWARQKALEDAVAQARKRLDELRSAAR